MTWLRIVLWLWLGLLVVDPVWAVRVFLWYVLGCLAVIVGLVVWHGIGRLRRTVRGWRDARRNPTFYPYGMGTAAESDYVRRERLP